jgi:hypothetical protein
MASESLESIAALKAEILYMIRGGEGAGAAVHVKNRGTL